MKTKLILLVILLTSIKLFSQSYMPFQFGNTRWKNAHYDFNMFIKDFCYFSTDTVGIVVNNLKYYPIERSVSPVPTYSNVNAYIRDDTAARKVYVLNLVDSTENLLYDFSVQGGDTVKGIKFNGSICNMATTFLDTIKIDSVVIRNYNGINRRVFIGKSIANHPDNPIPNTQNPYINIEGIGSAQDLLDPKPWPGTDPVYSINCYTYNSINYLGSSYDCAMFYTATDDDSLQNLFSISSTNGIFTIQNLQHKLIFWQLYNQVGELLLKGNDNEINLTNYPSGIYFLKINTDKKIQTVKIQNL